MPQPPDRDDDQPVSAPSYVVLEPPPGLITWDKPRPAARDDGLAASLRHHDSGQLFTRDELEAFLRARMERAAGQRLALLDSGEAEAVAGLLDELAALHPGEDLGHLARELAVRLYDRMGL